jgi:ferredoxin--NADP+ reductase/benzoate/toluate 1,2-dioxygenase reductase subunit
MAMHRVMGLRWFTPQTCSIRISRQDFDFLPGQHLLAGPPGGDLREYSLFSHPGEPWLEILIRVIPDGLVSRQLADLQAGDDIAIDGPHGYFRIREPYQDFKHCFVATGTGIAPFHAMVGAYPDLDFRLFHGIRCVEECYAIEDFPANRYIPCFSRIHRQDAGRSGRVTDVMSGESLDEETMYYLCGSCDMIYDMFRILQDKGIPRSNIFAETYY